MQLQYGASLTGAAGWKLGLEWKSGRVEAFKDARAVSPSMILREMGGGRPIDFL